ncbi:MAG: hypothetical protein JW727_02310 [Candidatus Aenigmarchaeota archaeon]|nr:hypothetical protein [Candidatus Aenigmarchaeota archaeon]
MNDVEKFVSETINQIKAALPEGYILNGNLDFEVSVATTQGKGGKIDLKLVGLGDSSDTQKVQKIKFSIVDERAQKKNLAQVSLFMKRIMEDLAKVDSLQNTPSLDYKEKAKPANRKG